MLKYIVFADTVKTLGQFNKKGMKIKSGKPGSRNACLVESGLKWFSMSLITVVACAKIL